MRGSRAVKMRALLAFSVLLCWGCVTPVIPLPPPVTDNMYLVHCDASKKTISFGGNADVTSDGFYLFIWNTNQLANTGIIIQARGYGGFPVLKDFPAVDGDQLWVWAKSALHEENQSDTVAVNLDCGKTKGPAKNGFPKRQ